MKITAIIPAYNEEETIYQVVQEVKKYTDEVIVINDGSIDATANLAKKAGALVCSHLLNRGQGAALQTGIRYALSNGAEIIVTFDADGQFIPSEIRDVVQPILDGEADIVLGSRFKKSKVPFFKKILLFGAIFFTRLTSGLNLTDTHNGFRALSCKAAEKICIRQDRMAHASEILNAVAKNKLRYREVPVTVQYLPHHLKKGQKISDYFKILFDLVLGKVIK